MSGTRMGGLHLDGESGVGRLFSEVYELQCVFHNAAKAAEA
jgi:hypothetical protein